MFNWLRIRLRNWLNNDSEESVEDRQPLSNKIRGRGLRSTDGDDLNDHNEPLRFNVYNASGGKVVEIRYYDRKKDHWATSLYVVNSDENFGDNIGKIIFMEMLKKV